MRPRRGLALPLSVALHLALLLALSRAPWPRAPASSTPRTHVVWVGEWRPAERPLERQAEPREPPVPPAEEPSTVAVPSAPTEPSNPSGADTELVRPVPLDAEEGSGETHLPPGIDWETAQRDAVSAVLEEQAREGGYRGFGPDDGVEEVAPYAPDPVTRKLFDGCRVMKSKIEGVAFGLLTAMTGGLTRLLPGFCLRGPHDELLAAIEPDYLRKRPYCVGRDGRLAVLDAEVGDLNDIKCRLVTDDEYAALTAEPVEERNRASPLAVTNSRE